MRNTLIVAGVAILGLTAFSFTPVGANVASTIMASTNSAKSNCLNALAAVHPNISIDSTDIHTYDINDDGRNDQIVRVTDTSSCGTSGCITEICLTEGSDVRIVPFGYATSEVRVLETKSESYRDIMVNNSVIMNWDGAHYSPAK